MRCVFAFASSPLAPHFFHRHLALLPPICLLSRIIAEIISSVNSQEHLLLRVNIFQQFRNVPIPLRVIFPQPNIFNKSTSDSLKLVYFGRSHRVCSYVPPFTHVLHVFRWRTCRYSSYYNVRVYGVSCVRPGSCCEIETLMLDVS